MSPRSSRARTVRTLVNASSSRSRRHARRAGRLRFIPFSVLTLPMYFCIASAVLMPSTAPRRRCCGARRIEGFRSRACSVAQRRLLIERMEREPIVVVHARQILAAAAAFTNSVRMSGMCGSPVMHRTATYCGSSASMRNTERRRTSAGSDRPDARRVDVIRRRNGARTGRPSSR